MPSVLTWLDGDVLTGMPRSARLEALEASHHAMWNYVTYRDAIDILGLDAERIYPGGTTRLDPAEWADLGWLTCFCGPPAAAVEAMREAVSAAALNQYTPDLLEPLRDAAAAALGRERDGSFEVIGTEGAQAGIALTLQACVDDGDEVIVSDPGYFHAPSAVLVAGGVPVSVRIDAASGFRLDPDAVAAAVTSRTRAIVVVDPVNPYGTVQTADELLALHELAERHDLVLIHDVTHAALRIGDAPPFRSLPSLVASDRRQPRPPTPYYHDNTMVKGAASNGAADGAANGTPDGAAAFAGERSVAVFSVSHCYGMAGARLGFLAGPRPLMRSCLRLKAALTRLNANLISQHGALAALGDSAYLESAGRTIARNLRHLEDTLAGADGVELPVRPVRGLSCAVDVSASGTTAQELTVALFARRIAVYPGDGLGESTAGGTIRLNLSRPDEWAMQHLRRELPEALAEAASGRYREPVAALLERKGTARAARLAAVVRKET